MWTSRDIKNFPAIKVQSIFINKQRNVNRNGVNKAEAGKTSWRNTLKYKKTSKTIIVGQDRLLDTLH